MRHKSDESLLLNPFFKCYAFFSEEEEIPLAPGVPAETGGREQRGQRTMTCYM